MTKNVTYMPSLFLSKYIDRFYVFEQSKKHDFELAPILPGTGLELLFHLNKPLSICENELPKGHIVCPRRIAFFDKNKRVAFLSVRFKSGAFRHFTSFSFLDLNNRYLSVQTLWKDKGVDLLERLTNCAEIENKIKEIERFLTQAFNDHHKKVNDKWDLILDELYYNFDSNTIKKLSEKATVSLRQFERNFKDQFGITAKEFQKLTRFQEVTKSILLNKKGSYLETILDHGYFDQSHFIKEFKTYTHKTPLAYFTTKNFDNHFYHTSVTEK